MKKQLTHAFKPRTRKSETPMLIFAGIDIAGAGSISIDQIRDTLLKEFPTALEKFPDYEQYFSISTYVALFAGLFFLLFPMSITSWLGRYLIGISLGYLVIGTYGITTGFIPIFYAIYWMAIILPILSRLNTINFYKNTTKLDFPIFIVLSLCLLAIGVFEFLKII